MTKWFVVLVLVALAHASPVKKTFSLKDSQCTGQCHPTSKDKVNIHLIPHSHDDVGWLKTVDQYFYGLRNDIQRAGVQYIISSTVEALKADPNRRFVQVETAFFWKWWQEQTESSRQDFRDLVNNGQLEMINGAWSMNDEACPNYQSTIDQFTWGLKTINDTVGVCGIPKIGWQIDPFGHSREQASLFSQFGFDGVFFARLDAKDRENRKATKTMDYLWQGSENINANIFGNVFPESLYYPPSGFCFDVECGDDPLIDDPESFDFNIITRASDFVDKMKEYQEYYPTNNVLVPMGGDFQYQAAEFNYMNMDKLIKYLKNNTDFNVIYSTPSCYIKAVNEANPELKLKVDDFFPYGSDDHSYWAGYFTSRPNSKRFERVGHKILQAAKQLISTYRMVFKKDSSESLRLLRETMGILQHHDAITGTEKQHVAQDYVRLLSRAIQHFEDELNTSQKDLNNEDFGIRSCLLSNISICDASSPEKFVVSLYNPLSRPVTSYIRIPVPGDSYEISGDYKSQVVDPIHSFDYVKLGSKPHPKELVIEAKDILEMSSYQIEITKTDKSKEPESKEGLKFGTKTTGFELDDKTNLLKSVTINGVTLNIKQELMYYQGSNEMGNRASGAYIFRPLNGDSKAQSLATEKLEITTTTGDLVDEVRQKYNDWTTQIIRVYKGEQVNWVEFDWLVGPIEVDNTQGIGKEIISRFTIEDFKSEGVFYTDSNGREQIKRTRNKRYDYEYDSTLEPISSNYYPVTSKIVLKDESKKLQVAVLNDRSQGGSSLEDGQLELMVHRRLLRDDAKGVDEALDEQEFEQGVVARGTHYLTFGSSESKTPSQTAKERILAQEILLPPYVLIGNATIPENSIKHPTLKQALPNNVNVLTLEPWTEDTYILRLEHILEKNDDDELSKETTVDLSNLFYFNNIVEMTETTLAGNQLLEEFNSKNKYQWKVQGETEPRVGSITQKANLKDDLKVTLSPMQIRTFIIKTEVKGEFKNLSS